MTGGAMTSQEDPDSAEKAEVVHHGRKELAHAIRTGAEKRPEQAFGHYFVGRHASCALGAAYEGVYRLAKEMGGQRPTKDLVWFFDCLEGMVLGCPAEGCKKRLLLGAMIVHLNDHHQWSREQIATWLEEQNGEVKRQNGVPNGSRT